jgi:hypothetical protein
MSCNNIKCHVLDMTDMYHARNNMYVFADK